MTAPARMRLYLINPSNPMVSILDVGESRWNRFRVWKPLGLMVIAGLTPDGWEITIIDENLGVPDYSKMPRPDLVGITAFTSQAPRAYELASRFRDDGATVVMGGIHATMCQKEASRYADTVVTGEAESVWEKVLEDVRRNRLKPLYEGGPADKAERPPARDDLLDGRYAFGAIQTTRGCPLHCSFCSVTSFNGARFRQRPIEHVIREFERVPEDLVLIVDDNLIGTRREHIKRAKCLFRAIIDANLKKKWIAQATINVANDDELITLAAAAGCRGLFIGLVAGSFIIGFDNDGPGIGRLIADTAERIGVDFVNVLFLTPLPGTRLWVEMESQNRVALDEYPEDWRYYTLTYPVARFAGLTLNEATSEMLACSERFYTIRKLMRRLWRNLWRRQSVPIGLAGALSYRNNIRIDRRKLDDFELQYGCKHSVGDERDEQRAETPMILQSGTCDDGDLMIGRNGRVPTESEQKENDAYRLRLVCGSERAYVPKPARQ